MVVFTEVLMYHELDLDLVLVALIDLVLVEFIILDYLAAVLWSLTELQKMLF